MSTTSSNWRSKSGHKSTDHGHKNKPRSQNSWLALEPLEERLAPTTNVILGDVSHITDTADISTLDDPSKVVYAVNFTPSDGNRVVRGVTFLHDRQVIPGATFVTPRNVNNWKTIPDLTGPDSAQFEAIMHDIRWALATGESLQANLTVTPGIPYRLQIFFDGNDTDGGGENRK